MFDVEYYSELVNRRLREGGDPGKENSLDGILAEIEQRGEFHIRDSARLCRGLPIDINLHDQNADGPHVAYPHYHDFFELIYVYRGEIGNLVNRRVEVTVDPSHVLLMNPNARHVLRAGREDSVIFNLLLRRSFIEDTLLNLIGADNAIFHFFLNSIYGEQEMRDFLFLPVNEEIQAHIHSIIREHCEEKPFYEQMIVSNLVLLFGEFARIQKQQADSESTQLAAEGKLPDILRYMKLNYAAVTLQSAAAHFNYSEAYFSRLIKKQTGKSFTEILSGIRFGTACNYLKNSSLTAEKISEIIGYQNVGNFFRAFKRIYGVSPSDFRRQSKPPGK